MPMRAIIQSWLQINALQGPSPPIFPSRQAKDESQKQSSGHRDRINLFGFLTEALFLPSFPSLSPGAKYLSPDQVDGPCGYDPSMHTHTHIHASSGKTDRQRERESRDRKNASSRAWTTSLDGTHIVESRPPGLHGPMPTIKRVQRHSSSYA